MCQAPDHQPGHRQIDQRLTGGWQLFIVFGQPPIHDRPGERVPHHPAARLDGEATGNRRRLLAGSHPGPADSGPPVLGELQRPAQGRLHPLSALAGVGAIRSDRLQAGQLAFQRSQQQLGAITARQSGGVHERPNDQPLRIDQQMALAPIDPLALHITPGPPTIAVLADGLSIMAALG